MTPSDIAVLKKLRRLWLLHAFIVTAVSLLIIIMAIAEAYFIYFLLGILGVLGAFLILAISLLMTGFNPPLPIMIIFLPIILVGMALIGFAYCVSHGELKELKLPRIVTGTGIKAARAEAGGYHIVLDSGKEYVITPSKTRKGLYTMENERGVSHDNHSLADLVGYIN